MKFTAAGGSGPKREDLDMIGDHDLRRRALAAYFRGGDTEQPEGHPRVITRGGLRYVVLSNVNGVLAVYRVRTHDGILRRMKRWPAAVEK